MLEEQLVELIGVVRAMNDNLFEIKQLLAGAGAARTPDEPGEESLAPASAAPTQKLKPGKGKVSGTAQVVKADGTSGPTLDETNPDLPQVKAALRKLQEKESRDAVLSLLKSFGAVRLSEVKPEDYPQLIERAAA